MPLTRANSTPAEQITLPLYPAIYLALGFLFVVQPASRTDGPAFDAARFVADPVPGLSGMAVWGIVFLMVGAVEATALVLNLSHRVYIRALIVGAGLAAFWSVALIVSAYLSPHVSYTSGVWLMIAPAAQAASARMLARHSHPFLSAE